MKMNLRAKRMARHHKRNRGGNKLNLVSLMDIFTILVFFLLVNSSDVEVLQTDKTITLPESFSEQRPDTTLVVKLNADAIVVGNLPVANVKDVLNSEDVEIEALTQELQRMIERRPELTELEKQQGRAVTIMGDQAIPYELLKKVMTTCAKNDFRNIALAVSQIPTDEPKVEGAR